MTQKDTIIKILQELGGRASLSEIYPRVIKAATFKPNSNMHATIRATLQRNPETFRPSRGKKGWWELVSFQEEIAVRDKEIAELREELEQLKKVPTEDEFVKRLVRETKNLYKHERGKTEVIRQILYKLGRTEAEAELDAWIESKQHKPSVAFAGDLVLNKETNIDTNYGPNIEQHSGTLSLPENKG